MKTSPFIFQFLDSSDDSIAKALQSRRPLLTHLNADSSWLLQLPCPQHHYLRTGQSRYNILVDPWLQGTQVDIAPWFSSQWHAVKSQVQTLHELRGHLGKFERISSLSTGESDNGAVHQHSASKDVSDNLSIDAVIISHEFSDHCHKETLLELDPATPIFATTKAYALISSWKHFTTVSKIPVFAPLHPDWEKYSMKPLPGWIGVSRIVSKSDFVQLHSAILLTFSLDQTAAATTVNRKSEPLLEALVYTPHGIQAQDLRQIHATSPSINVLALLHGLQSVSLSPLWQLNLGAHNGLQAQRACKAKYWIATHDEVKNGAGLIAPLLKRKAISLHDAMEQEKQQEAPRRESTSVDATQMIFAELGNGESVLLE